ncbi:hypothetical protein A9R05_06715 [Burkholderia sp. KK1]|nr:hypothetical protein A9R05_06715 [Burkholderia sp. KK1]
MRNEMTDAEILRLWIALVSADIDDEPVINFARALLEASTASDKQEAVQHEVLRQLFHAARNADSFEPFERVASELLDKSAESGKEEAVLTDADWNELYDFAQRHSFAVCLEFAKTIAPRPTAQDAEPRHWNPVYNTDPVNRACGELPEGWQIEIGLERGAGWVDLRSPEGKQVTFDDDADKFGWKIHKAIDAAIVEEPK